MVKKLEVLLYPNPILLQKSEKITQFDKALKELSQNMLKTVKVYKGIGLAAPQIGILKRIFVMQIEEEETKKIQSYICVNPEIKDAEGEIVFEEGCLSIPNMNEKVTRKKKLTLIYQNLEGKQQQLKAEKLKAICIQHEIDHLNGVLFIHRISPLKRKLLLSKYKKVEQNKIMSAITFKKA